MIGKKYSPGCGNNDRKKIVQGGGNNDRKKNSPGRWQ
jgi:hypothetical protein